jgi:hypothetical protein
MATVNYGCNFVITQRGVRVPVKQRSQSSGKWAFEITSISGSKCFYAGFISENNCVTLNGYGNSPRIWYNVNYINALSHSINDLNTYTYTLDIDNHMFKVYHKGVLCSCNFTDTANSSENWMIIIGGGCNADQTDLMYVNLGESEFKNNIPPDYKPWIRTIPKCTFHNAGGITISLSICIGMLLLL